MFIGVLRQDVRSPKMNTFTTENMDIGHEYNSISNSDAVVIRTQNACTYFTSQKFTRIDCQIFPHEHIVLTIVDVLFGGRFYCCAFLSLA